MSLPNCLDDSSTEKSNKCCCGILHIKTGIKVIIALMMINLIMSFIEMHSAGKFEYGIANTAIYTLIIGCLIAALVNNKSEYVIPVIIVQVLSFYFYIGYLMYITTKHIDLKDKNVFVGAIILVVLNILRNLWFSSVTYKFYKYLKEKEKLIFPK